jgi:hypothetical protein
MAGEDDAMKGAVAPPRWAEALLERLLAAADRETVAGDLREEFVEAVVPRVGRRRAEWWYLRQVASLALRPLADHGALRNGLLALSFFTLLCGCWLAYMEFVLQHDGYASRSGMDLGVAAVGLATIMGRLLHVGARGERWLWIGALALIAIGGSAFAQDAAAGHFEGFVLIISVALVAQGTLMLLTLGRSAKSPRGARGQAS